MSDHPRYTVNRSMIMLLPGEQGQHASGVGVIHRFAENLAG